MYGPPLDNDLDWSFALPGNQEKEEIWFLAVDAHGFHYTRPATEAERLSYYEKALAWQRAKNASDSGND